MANALKIRNFIQGFVLKYLYYKQLSENKVKFFFEVL